MSGRSVVILCVYFFSVVRAYAPAFDTELYENVLQPELCEAQLRILGNDSLFLQFLDASSKFPTGVLGGNLLDLGDYFQCLALDAYREDQHFEGKYCSISVDLAQIQFLFGSDLRYTSEGHNDATVKKFFQTAQVMQRGLEPAQLSGNLVLSYCIPKVCQVDEAIRFYLSQLQITELHFTENFCRLPNDKPYAPADYVAFGILGVIALMTIVSTSYDVYNKVVQNKETDQLARSFSLYTNTRRFLSFPSRAGTLSCIDGIRSISMMWVVVGHTFVTTTYFGVRNAVDVAKYTQSYASIWITSAGISVDTFLMLSGILCTYTTMAKATKGTFVRNLHFFYLNRLLRLFPLLAFYTLLQASILHRVSDGPLWGNVGMLVEACREYWWSALLHVQNYVNPRNICLGHTWYLSVDIQLYIVCPIIIIFLFGRRFISWTALTSAFLLSLVSVSVYSYTYNFQGFVMSENAQTDRETYMEVYYYNTLTRAPPFLVGMAFGFLLHNTKNRRIRLSKIQILFLWILCFAMMSLAIIPVNYMSQDDYDNQGFSNFLNSYVRSIWAVALGWIVFACQQGYAGPINWFLSSPMWKLPARLSYSVYLIHSPIMWVTNASWVDTHYFTVGQACYRFMADLSLSTLVSFVACITVDAPFSTLQKLLLEGRKKPPLHGSDKNGAAKKEEGETNSNANTNIAKIVA